MIPQLYGVTRSAVRICVLGWWFNNNGGNNNSLIQIRFKVRFCLCVCTHAKQTTSFVTVHCFGAYAPPTLPFTDCVFFTVRALWFQLVLFTQLQPSNVPTQTNVSGFFYTKISLPSNFAVHMPFQEHVSFWLDGVQLYNIHFSYCSRLEAVPSCVGKGLSEGWRWRIQFCTKWWWIYGNWMPWWQHLTCRCVDWRRYFSLMKMPLPKATCGYSHPSIEREHLVFLSSLDESFDGNAATKRNFDCVTSCCSWETLGGSAERAPKRFNPANESLIFSIPKKKSRNERPNY